MVAIQNLFNQKALKKSPLVISLSGLDPTGGAGISADIETLKLTYCHPLPLISCQTNQNGNFFEILNISDTTDLIDQLDAVFDEFSQEKIKVCKIGLIANNKYKNQKQLIDFIFHLRKRNPEIKIVFDPIIQPTASKNKIGFETLYSTILHKPFNQNDILTPNREEFFSLCNISDSNQNQVLDQQDSIVQKALKTYQKMAIENLLITTINKNKKQLEHWLVQFNQSKQNWKFKSFYSDALIDEYHGSGCILSASLAGFLAHDQDLEFAIGNALNLTQLCLKYSNLKGICQNYPNRLIPFDLMNGIDNTDFSF